MATTTSNDIIDIIKDLIEQNIPKDRYESIWYGDPLNIPNKLYPSLTIFGESVTTSLGRTQNDREDQVITIKQLIDKRMIIKHDQYEVFGLKLLREWLFGKGTDGKYADDTLYKLFREKHSLTDSNGNQRIQFQQDFSTTFQIDIDPAITTYESTTTFTVSREVVVDNRT